MEKNIRIILIEKSKLLRMVLEKNLSLESFFKLETLEDGDKKFSKDNVIRFIRRRRNVSNIVIINYLLEDCDFEEINQEIRKIIKVPILCITSNTNVLRDEDIKKTEEDIYYIKKKEVPLLVENITKIIKELFLL